MSNLDNYVNDTREAIRSFLDNKIDVDAFNNKIDEIHSSDYFEYDSIPERAIENLWLTLESLVTEQPLDPSLGDIDETELRKEAAEALEKLNSLQVS